MPRRCWASVSAGAADAPELVDDRWAWRHVEPGPLELPTRLAGTTSRFITALAALGAGPYVIDGEPPLRARPMAPLHDALDGARGNGAREQNVRGTCR